MSLSQFSLVGASKPSEAHLRLRAVGERLQAYLCTADRFCDWSFGGISRRKSHDPWASRKNFSSVPQSSGGVLRSVFTLSAQLPKRRSGIIQSNALFRTAIPLAHHALFRERRIGFGSQP